jgi:hypothetical protein
MIANACSVCQKHDEHLVDFALIDQVLTLRYPGNGQQKLIRSFKINRYNNA